MSADPEKAHLLGDGSKAEERPSFLHMTLFMFPLSIIWATMGMIVLPAEAIRLFPNNESAFLGVMLVVVGVAQLAQPVAGVFSDNHRSTWGRRRPFLFWGTIGCLFTVTGMWLSSKYYMPWAYCFFLFLTQVGLNVVFAAQASIVPDFVSEGKGEASGITGVLQFLGNLFGMGAIIVIAVWKVDFHWTYFVYALGMTCALAFVLFLKEKATDHLPYKATTPADIIRSFTIDLEGDRDFFWVFVGRTFYYMGTAQLTFVYYYLRDLMEIKSDHEVRLKLGIIGIIAMLLAICVAIPTGKLSDDCTWGRKCFIYIACTLLAVTYAGYAVAPLFGPEVGMWLVYCFAGIYGLGSGCYIAVDYALALDTLPEKVKGSSEALGLWGIASFIGCSVGPVIGGLLLEYVGEAHAEHTEQQGKEHYGYYGYVAMLCFGMVCSALAAFVTCFIKKVN